jgi:predicted dehydrogenase
LTAEIQQFNNETMAMKSSSTTHSIGLIGFGNWARRAYLPILREMRHVKLAAVAARSESTRQLAGKELGDEVRLYGDYRELLADRSVESVLISLPNELHAESIEAAVKSGKNVFFEPPVGLNQTEIHRVLYLLDQAGQRVQVDLELRYLPVMRRVRDLIAGGRLGEPLMANVRLWCDWGCDGGRWKEVENQGFFLWLGCWYLDVLDDVFGQQPLDAQVAGGYAVNGRLMDHGVATLTYPKGRVGIFQFNLLAGDPEEMTLQVAGTRGEVRVDLQEGTCRWRTQGSGWEEEVAVCSLPAHGFVGMRESIADFVEAVTENKPVVAGKDVCRRVNLAALACAMAEKERRQAYHLTSRA